MVKTVPSSPPASSPPASSLASRVAMPLLVAASWAAVAITLGVLYWSTHRGLDVDDESFALLLYRYPGEYPGGFSSFSLLVNKFLNPATTLESTYRLWSYGLTVLGPVLFGLSFCSWLRAELQARGRMVRSWFVRPGFVVPWLIVGALLTFSISPRTLSYNGITSWLVLCSAAALLAALRAALPPAGPRSVPAASLGWLVLAGLLLGLELFVKVSSAGLVLGAIGLVVLAACWQQGWRTVASSWVALGLGVGLGVGGYFALVQPAGIWWSVYQAATKSLMSAQYSPAKLLGIYASSLLHLLHLLAYPWGVAFAVLAGVFYWQLSWAGAATRTAKLGAGGAIAGIAAFMLYQAHKRSWYANTHLNNKQSLAVLAGLFGLLAVLTVMGQWARWRAAVPGPRAFRVPAVAALLLALPLLISAGTVNDLSINMLCDITGWFALVVLALAWWPAPGQLAIWPPVLLLLGLAYATEQTVWGTLQAPYLLPGTMAAESQPIKLAGFREPLLVSPGVHQMFTQVQQLLRQGGFRPGDPLIALYDLPGVVYAVGGISPGQPWYFSGRDAGNCAALRRSPLPLARACLLLTAEPEKGLVEALARQAGHHFPEDYLLLGQVNYPYADNAYGWYATRRVVSVYKPR